VLHDIKQDAVLAPIIIGEIYRPGFPIKIDFPDIPATEKENGMSFFCPCRPSKLQLRGIPQSASRSVVQHSGHYPADIINSPRTHFITEITKTVGIKPQHKLFVR